MAHLLHHTHSRPHPVRADQATDIHHRQIGSRHRWARSSCHRIRCEDPKDHRPRVLRTEETSLVPASLPTLSRSNQRKEKERRGYVETKDTNIYTCIYIYIMHTNFDISRPRDLHAADLKPLKRISSGDLFLARSTCRASSRPRRAETGGGGGGGRVPTYEDRDPPRKHRMEASWQESAAGTRIPGALLLITSNPSTRAPPQRRIPPVFPPLSLSLSLICQPMAARLNSNSPLPSRPLFTQDKE